MMRRRIAARSAKGSGPRQRGGWQQRPRLTLRTGQRRQRAGGEAALAARVVAVAGGLTGAQTGARRQQ
jgi:hypothetical protein